MTKLRMGPSTSVLLLVLLGSLSSPAGAATSTSFYRPYFPIRVAKDPWTQIVADFKVPTAHSRHLRAVFNRLFRDAFRSGATEKPYCIDLFRQAARHTQIESAPGLHVPSLRERYQDLRSRLVQLEAILRVSAFIALLPPEVRNAKIDAAYGELSRIAQELDALSQEMAQDKLLRERVGTAAFYLPPAQLEHVALSQSALGLLNAWGLVAAAVPISPSANYLNLVTSDETVAILRSLRKNAGLPPPNHMSWLAKQRLDLPVEP